MPSLLEALAPPACAGCGRYGSLFCAACRAALEPPQPEPDRFLVADAGAVVGDALTVALAAFAYRGPLRKALARLKYVSATRLAAPLAVAARPVLDRLLAISGPATLVPVPLHATRQRERGYNQAALLAHELGRRAEQPVVALLERREATIRQHGLNRAERLRNLRSAFAVIAPPPSAVIVVDDILTTSATLEACASVLRAAGCASVYGFALGREV